MRYNEIVPYIIAGLLLTIILRITEFGLSVDAFKGNFTITLVINLLVISLIGLTFEFIKYKKKK